MTRTFVALGSNLGNAIKHIKVALIELQTLPYTQLINVSPIYRSSPLGPQNQPDFMNAVAEVQTELSALELLIHLQQLENLHGRIRTGEHWGPRTLDLDILLYGNEIIFNEKLIIPHPGLKYREFVVIPLADLEPHLILPSGETIHELVANCKRQIIRVDL